MDWVCAYFVEKFQDNSTRIAETFGYSSHNHSNSGDLPDNKTFSFKENESVTAQDLWPKHYVTYEFVVVSIIIPCLCLFGIIGNLLNIFILMKKVKEGTDNLETGATVGLIALAVSDLTFCLCTLVATFVPGSQMIFKTRNLSYVVVMYWNYAQNVLIKTSTWFTVVLAMSRYFAVCYPMKARQHLRCSHTVWGIVLSALFWISFNLPLLWIFDVEKVDCSAVSETLGSYYVLVVGAFHTNLRLKIAMEYSWAVVGFFIPVAILAYCNYRLVLSLRASRSLRCRPDSGRAKPRAYDPQRRISITLVCIALMFFLLVCPSELLQFYATAGESFFPLTYYLRSVAKKMANYRSR